MTGSYYRDYSAIIKGRFEGEEAVPCGPSSRKEPARIRNRKILKNGKTRRVCGGGGGNVYNSRTKDDRPLKIAERTRRWEQNLVEIG